MDFQTIMFNLFLALITAAVPPIGSYAVLFIRQHLGDKKAAAAKGLATDAVTYAQQIAKKYNLDDAGKLNAALGHVKEFAAKRGLSFTDEQWEKLLEPAYKEAKLAWDSVGNPDVSSTIPAEPEPAPAAEQKADSVKSPQEVIKDTLDSVGQQAATAAVSSFVQQIQDIAAKATVPQTPEGATQPTAQ